MKCLLFWVFVRPMLCCVQASNPSDSCRRRLPYSCVGVRMGEEETLGEEQGGRLRRRIFPDSVDDGVVQTMTNVLLCS